MNLLPSNLQDIGEHFGLSRIEPSRIAPAQTKAVGDLAGLPQGLVTRRDSAFNSQELFTDISTVGNYVSEAMQQDTRRLAELFVCHDLCFTCITQKTQAQYGATLEVVRKTASGVEVIEDHPFLNVIQNPNDQMHDQDLFEAWTVHHNLFGKFTCLLIRENSLEDLANPNGKVIGIMPIRPDQIIKKYDSNKRFIGYEFRTTPYGKAQFCAPESVMIDVYYNPTQASLGTSPTILASRWMALDNSLTQMNRAFLDGGGLPTLILMLTTQLPDGTMKNADTIKMELTQNKQAWDEQFKKGGLRQRKPAFTAGMTPFELASGVEAQILDSFYDRIESRVAAIYGVPAHRFQVGMKHGDGRANNEEGNIVFAEQTIWTQLDRMRLRLQRSSIFSEYAQKGEHLRYNLSNCKIFHYQELELAESIRKDFKLGFMTGGYAAQKLNYPEPPKEIKDLNYFQILAQSRPAPVLNNATGNKQIGNGTNDNSGQQ